MSEPFASQIPPAQPPPGETAQPVQPVGVYTLPHFPAGPIYPPPPGGPPRRGGRGWIVLLLILLAGSAAFNGLLLLMVFSAFGGGHEAYQTRVLRAGASNQTIAVVPLYDVIDGNMAAWVKRTLEELADDKNVKAVVLRVDSPGGTVSASDQINRAVRKFRETSGKAVVVSQGGYATSGGYYVSAGGDYIFAEPTTWTGNIGVIMVTFVAREGLQDKLGIKPVVITSSNTPFKDVPSLFRDMSEPEQAYVRSLIENAYQRFVTVVQQGRPKLTREQVLQLANGKVYTSDEALKSGLVDASGYLEDAWSKAAELKGLRKPNVVLYTPRTYGLLGQLLLGHSSLPALDKLQQDPAEAAEKMLAPRVRAMYLYGGLAAATEWPKMRYAAD